MTKTTFRSLGYFIVYTPRAARPDVIYFQNETEQDFYEIVRSAPSGDVFFMVDADGLIIGADTDLSAIAPFDCSVIAAENGTALLSEFRAGGRRFVWTGDTIIQEPDHAV